MSFRMFIKQIIPRKILNFRHLFFAWYGAIKYQHPSEKLLVVGVTGTSGKSTTIFFLKQLLEYAGYTVGVLSTIEFGVAGESTLNDKKMTMLGKTYIQKYLRCMVEANCDIAIIETTSEGRLQYRHRCINYDTIVLTNLYPEHIESHGSFAKYRQAKIDIFSYVAKSKRKVFKRKKIKKTAIVSTEVDGGYAGFLHFIFEQKIVFGIPNTDLYAKNIVIDTDGIHFTLQGKQFDTYLFGVHNVKNILAAIAVAQTQGISLDILQKAVSKMQPAPGRVEEILEAHQYGFRVFVDYAFEPRALNALYDVADLLKPKRIIHVAGQTGGGRDKGRRKPTGQLIGTKADIHIITNEDPYDEDPLEIMHQVREGDEDVGKVLDRDVFEIVDRQNAIDKAMELAQPGDLVLVTGKGSEQAIVTKNQKLISWDDREAVRQALKKWGNK